jgi:hypothetical protein
VTFPITEAPLFQVYQVQLEWPTAPYFSKSVLDLQAFFQRYRSGGDQLCRLGHKQSSVKPRRPRL